jgi:2,3-dihydroxybenzoate decarboxylase
MVNKPYVIAIEEHYSDSDVTKACSGNDRVVSISLRERLADPVDIRVREMDAAGIDLQVLSHAPPATQRVDAQTAVPLAQIANDRLCELVQTHSERFAAFATLPTAAPEAAADELERAVVKLGFRGAMVHGLANGLFLDHRRFWPIFRRAHELQVPIYLHPAAPDQRVVDAYYGAYLDRWPTLSQSAWGFAVETGTLAIRLILSGLFSECPQSKIILGHLGEGIPFFLWRINQSFSRQGGSPTFFRDCFCENFYITTSGFFSTPALQCCAAELGMDRIMFAVDYPIVDNAKAVEWLATAPLTEADRNKIAHANARRLLKL